ncbi:CDC20 [Cordylochernes scorpioides]|uniref:CDC20 n=1 Tax=Cordylochernes scorpioides TaxID=51811 RepID=A0ABY6LGW7_9ARAC|nr:CDC20 [Cordylochernes scorpioides]
MSKGFQEYENLSPKSQEVYKAKTEALYGPDIMNKKVITYQNKAPQPPEEYDQKLKVLYSSVQSSSKKKKRVIPSCPDRILDAPEILNDYYINVIDWSPTNQIAVCLSGQLYVWDAVSSKITQLSSLEEGDHYGAVAWAGQGKHLAVGTSEGTVEIWDVSRGRRLRSMACEGGRVGALAWNSHMVSSGQANGSLTHHDVRVANHVVSSLPTAHSATVCGLHWSPDNRMLASGGNDNTVQVWSLSSPTSLHCFRDHQAAVKAVRWCPWQHNILATGGGTGDRCIRLWNITRGYCFKTIDTGSQEHRELVSGHGFTKHELNIWKYPDLTKVAELQELCCIYGVCGTGHEGRVLNLAMSPDGAYVMSAGADETLRIWHCFAVDEERKKKEALETERVSNSLAGLSIGRSVIR